MFKRPRLRAAFCNVNALPVLTLLFLVASCGEPREPSAEPPAVTEAGPGVPPQQGLVLPAVWSTRDLGAPLKSIGVAGELGSTVAVAFADGGLQLFDFEGDSLTDKAALNVAALGEGRYMLLSGVAVTLFPGVDRAGDLKVYIHGGEMSEPLAYALDSGASEVAGLCSALPVDESDGVLRLAFWTGAQPKTLVSGRVVQVREELAFLPDDPVTSDTEIKACLLTQTGAVVYSAPARAAIRLERRGKSHTLVLDTSGGFSVTDVEGVVSAFTVSDGLSVRAPRLAVDMAGTGDTRGGGYPGGVVVIGGEDENGENRIVYVDPSLLTLSVFE